MGLRLAVERGAWEGHLRRVADAVPGLVPVVKGNGYGFGRVTLMPFAVEHTSPDGQIAVGTVYEATDVPVGRTPLVLTPHLDVLPDDLHAATVLTVGSGVHVAALQRHGWNGRVAVKLASSMHRYGVAPDVLPALLRMIDGAGWDIDSYALHFPLVGTPDAHLAEVEAWLPVLAPHPRRPVSLSHLPPDACARLRNGHPDIEWRHRVGTALWHADKGVLHLTADVLDVHPVEAGETVGYRGVRTPRRGHLVLVAAGSAHGVRSLDDGRSPFHHARTRLTLLEPPHMHTSMLFVPHGEPVPAPGERIDVQRPLTTTTVDELVWLP